MHNTLRIVIFLFSSVFLFGQQPLPSEIKNFKSLAWLIGTWSRTNAKPDRSGFEIWKKHSETEYVGSGISMKGKDTIFVEKLKIIVKEDAIFYEADVPQNKSAVLFKAIELTDNHITFENPEHDFPKKISYHFDGKVLKATISGDGKSIDYLFKRH